MTTKDINSSIAGLIKIAEQMVDNVETPKSVGPDEAYDALEGIISQLEALAQSIPTQGGNPEITEPQSDAPVEAPKEDPRVAKLEKTVKQLTAEIEAKKRADIAQEFASYFSDPKVANTKADEILNSKEPIDVLEAKLNTIAEYAESNGESPVRKAQSGFTSYVRVAQANGTRMHTL